MYDDEWGQGLRREIIEARNQAIKTDNQVKNLCLDVRAFERRFDTLEQRTRLSGVAANVIVALVLSASAYAIVSATSRTYERELMEMRSRSEQQVREAESAKQALGEELAHARGAESKRAAASAVGLRIARALDERRETEAGRLLDDLDPTAMSPLEQQLSASRFADLRRRQAVQSYREGRQAETRRERSVAIAAHRRSLALDPQSVVARAAREHLAWALWQAGDYVGTEPLVRAWLNEQPDEPTGAARYLLATSLIRQGKRDPARAAFLQVAGAEGQSHAARYAKSAGAYLAAMANDAELPEDLPDGRVRPARAAAGQSVPPLAAQANEGDGDPR